MQELEINRWLSTQKGLNDGNCAHPLKLYILTQLFCNLQFHWLNEL
jgi:hypothetical protein